VEAAATASSKLANPDCCIAPATSIVLSAGRSREDACPAPASGPSHTSTSPRAWNITCVKGSPLNHALRGANTAPIFMHANQVPTSAALL